MKKVCCFILCLLLALLSPLSGLAEPRSWPFEKRGDAVQSGQAAVTVKIDPEAVNAAVDWYYDLQMKAYDELAETANLHFDIQDLKRPLSAARAAAKAYIPAAAVLADSAELLIQSGEGLTCCILQVNGAPWFTLNLIARPEEGDTLLTSDLFPACALSLPQGRSLTSGLSGDVDEAYQTLVECWQELLPMLPELAGFDLLGQFYAASAQTMEYAEAHGYARRDGDKLIYDAEGTLTADGDILENDPMEGLFSRHELDVDERLYRLYALFDRLGREAFARNRSSSDFWQEEGAADTLPVLSENATDADYVEAVNEYIRLWYANEVKTASVRQHMVLENGTFTLEYTATETAHHEVKGDAETIRKLMERYETLADWEPDDETASTSVLLLTPALAELRFADEYGAENVLRLDTGAENKVLFTYTSLAESVELLLTRTDEGQQWALTLPLGTLTEEENAGPLRMTVSMDNDVRWMNIALTMLGMELGVIRADYAYSGEPAPVPDVSGLTVIPSDDPEALQALRDGLRAAGIPQLTRLIATGLPDGAQGMIVPLLSLVTSLAQIGQ